MRREVGVWGRRGQSTMEYLLIFAAVVGIVAWAAANLVTGTADKGGVDGKKVGLRLVFDNARSALEADGQKFEDQLTSK